MKTSRVKPGSYVSEYDTTADNTTLSCCDIPGTSLSVCISEEAGFRITEHYRERRDGNSLLSGHSQSPAASVTGIVLGRYEIEERRIVSIEQLHPVAWRPCIDGEQRPLTPEQIISPLVHDKTKPSPIGFYVLYDRFDPELLNRDLSLFSRYFTNPDSVFVLFGKSADQIVAQIFARGNAKTPFHSVNLTLHVDEVAMGRQRLPSSPQPDEPSSSPAFRPALPPLAGSAPDSPVDGRRGRIWAAVALVMLFLVGSAWYEMGIQLPIPSAPQPDQIGLRIERTGRDVQITWDSASTLLRDATLGLFRIRDGAGNKDIRVSPEELKQGRLLYIPASNDLDIHMKVFTRNNRIVEESVRVIDGTDRLERPERPPPVKEVIPESHDNRISAERSARPPQMSRQSTASPAVKSPKPFVPPVATARVPDQTEAAASLAPPQLSPQDSQHGTNFSFPHREALRVQPPAPSSPPAEQPRRPVTNVAATVRPVEPVVSPPTPRQQVPIILPDHLKRLISRDITIEIQCTVAADGRVTNITAPPATASLEGQLSVLAAATARKWLFTPARLHGQPVSSDFVITFSFHRSNR